MADRESEKRRAFCRRVLILVKELVEKGLGARREAIGRERWDFRFCRLWPILNFGSVFPFSHLRRLERVFRCCSVCETMEDYKEGYLMMWANYFPLQLHCWATLWWYLWRHISYHGYAQGAQKRPLNFGFCKLSEKLIWWPTIFISLLESFLNSLTFQTVWKKL